MPKILMIAKLFPPMFDIGGKRAYRFAKYLHEMGWQPVLFISQMPANKAKDESLKPLNPEIKVYAEYLPPWFKDSGNNLSDATIQRHQPKKNRILLFLEKLFAWPVDRHIWLSFRNALKLKKIIKDEQVDLIWATSAPYSSLIFGALAKWLTGKPLCLDLRDPWTLNFLEKNRPAWVQWLNQKIEKKVICYADQVVFTCEATTQAYQKKYPFLKSDHFKTITNAFDPDLMPQNLMPQAQILSEQSKKSFQMVHFGNCYGPRNLRSILEALVELRDQLGIDLSNLELLNLGKISDEDLAFAQNHQLSDLFVFKKAVPYQEGLSLLKQSQLQILMAYGDETLFIPAKFFDYLLTQSPILCISQPSDLTDYIDQTKTGVHFAPHQTKEIALFLKDCLSQSQILESIRIHRNIKRIDDFGASYTTQQLIAIFEKILKIDRSKSSTWQSDQINENP